MTYHFKLQLKRVECLYEAIGEWGKDEMHLIGFGVTRRGVLFATGYKDLGSYHEGDVNKSSAIPLTLFEADLPDDARDVLFYFWLVEEDGGGVRSAAADLEAEFRASFLEKETFLSQAQFPRDCIPFTAFYRTVAPFQDSLQEASTDGRNDELYFPFDLLLRYGGENALHFSQDLPLRRSKDAGDYIVTLHFSYEHANVILE